MESFEEFDIDIEADIYFGQDGWWHETRIEYDYFSASFIAPFIQSKYYKEARKDREENFWKKDLFSGIIPILNNEIEIMIL